MYILYPLPCEFIKVALPSTSVRLHSPQEVYAVSGEFINIILYFPLKWTLAFHNFSLCFHIVLKGLQRNELCDEPSERGRSRGELHNLVSAVIGCKVTYECWNAQTWTQVNKNPTQCFPLDLTFLFLMIHKKKLPCCSLIIEIRLRVTRCSY